jgi:hypothetical protein
VLSSGKKTSNGYEALAELDSNLDGRISSADINFADLKVWTDTNSNGITDAGELLAMQDLGIVSLDLQATSTTVKDNGNTIGLVSSFEDASGNNRTLADVWFVTDKQNTAAATPNQILTVEPTPMQAGVFGLVDAMAAFVESGAAKNFDLYGDGTQATASAQTAATGGASLFSSTSQLAQALSQFDANGKPVRLVAAEPVVAELTLTDSKPRDSANGFLAIGNG